MRRINERGRGREETEIGVKQNKPEGPQRSRRGEGAQGEKRHRGVGEKSQRRSG